MRVALVCGALRPELDGVAGYVLRLAAELRIAGADVRILHTGRAAPGAGGGACSVGRRWDLLAVARAGRLLRGADVVHVQFAPSMYGFAGAIGALPPLLRAPLITTLHEYGWWRLLRLPDRVWRALERRRLADRETGRLVPASRAVIVTNPAHRAALSARFADRVPAELVPIGANVGVAAGLDRDAARIGVRHDLGLAPSAVLVAFFGFVHPVKGVRHLVDAIAMLRGEGRDVHLLVVGGFESLALPADEATAFEAELRGLVDAAGVRDHVTVTGYRDEPAASRLLLAADAAALPFTAGVTTKSGSLLTVLAHGLPTVVTDAGDPDLVDGVTCVAATPVRDAAALASALRRLLDDPPLRERIAAAGAALAATRSWPAIARRHRELYERVTR